MPLKIVKFKKYSDHACAKITGYINMYNSLYTVVQITKPMYIVQVTGYGENGTGDANDVWRLEIPGAKDGEVVLTVVSKFVYRLVSVGG